MINLYRHLTIPDYVTDAMDSPAMKRIEGVDMNCGMRYTSFPLFSEGEFYSRAQHSKNVSLLVYYFTEDPAQCLAGLFHDIATPAFSHVIDFLNGDYLNQESTEELTSGIISSDPVICNILRNLNLPVSAVSDYHQYPIADNDMPKLSCDRLEYTLSNAVNYKFASSDEIQCMLDDLCVLTNEYGDPEIGFLTPNTGMLFARLALRCGKVYSGQEDRYSMEILARLLKDAIIDDILTEMDLYGEELPLINKLQHSPLKDRWNSFTKLHKVTVCSKTEGISVNPKRRYIDPLIKRFGRASVYEPAFADEIRSFLNEDYSVYLKGI